MDPTDIHNRTTADGRRRLALTDRERKEFLKREKTERLVSMYLTLEGAMTRSEMAEELDITVRQLKTITESDLFKELYEEQFSTLGQDPRLQAVQQGLSDLLPQAFVELRRALSNEDVPWTVKFNAIKEVLKLNGIIAKTPAMSDRKELAEFLGSAGINIGEMNVNVSHEYQDAVDRAEAGDIVTVEPTNIVGDNLQQINAPTRPIDGEPAKIIAK
jgi:hypothetical protein